jgi:hypothetical protein
MSYATPVNVRSVRTAGDSGGSTASTTTVDDVETVGDVGALPHANRLAVARTLRIEVTEHMVGLPMCL